MKTEQPVKVTVEADTDDPNAPRRLVLQLADGYCYTVPLELLTS